MTGKTILLPKNEVVIMSAYRALSDYCRQFIDKCDGCLFDTGLDGENCALRRHLPEDWRIDE